jgi:hypothetical protein
MPSKSCWESRSRSRLRSREHGAGPHRHDALHLAELRIGLQIDGAEDLPPRDRLADQAAAEVPRAAADLIAVVPHVELLLVRPVLAHDDEAAVGARRLEHPLEDELRRAIGVLLREEQLRDVQERGMRVHGRSQE